MIRCVERAVGWRYVLRPDRGGSGGVHSGWGLLHGWGFLSALDAAALPEHPDSGFKVRRFNTAAALATGPASERRRVATGSTTGADTRSAGPCGRSARAVEPWLAGTWQTPSSTASAFLPDAS